MDRILAAVWVICDHHSNIVTLVEQRTNGYGCELPRQGRQRGETKRESYGNQSHNGKVASVSDCASASAFHFINSKGRAWAAIHACRRTRTDRQILPRFMSLSTFVSRRGRGNALPGQKRINGYACLVSSGGTSIRLRMRRAIRSVYLMAVPGGRRGQNSGSKPALCSRSRAFFGFE